jgi:hypothetical protein
MSLGFDVIILLMPLFVIWKLQMPVLRKVAVMMIFWLGALCCVAAGVRLHLLNKAVHGVTDNANAYADLTTAFVWAELEPNASVMAASLPMLRPLFSSEDNSGFTSIFSGWRIRVSSLFNNGRSSQGYAKTKSETDAESTRELTVKHGGISVAHDIELGYYNVPDRT